LKKSKVKNNIIITNKIKIVFTILLIAWFGKKGICQPADSITVDFNHIFFCIDSVSYDNLFKHEFLGKIFANARELTNKTVTDSWTGKYIMGRQSYVEVFASNSYKGTNPQLGDKFGDLGIVFKTKKPGDIKKIDEQIKNNKRATDLKLNEIESHGKTVPFSNHCSLF